TRIWLACDGRTAAGMLLQKLPTTPADAKMEEDADTWPRVGHLADTVQAAELLGLPTQQLLRRLFHEEDVRLFEGQPIRFHCSCSRTSVAGMLRMLGHEEIADILAEREHIDVQCDFCGAQYRFDRVDAEQLFAEGSPAPGSSSQH